MISPVVTLLAPFCQHHDTGAKNTSSPHVPRRLQIPAIHCIALGCILTPFFSGFRTSWRSTARYQIRRRAVLVSSLRHPALSREKLREMFGRASEKSRRSSGWWVQMPPEACRDMWFRQCVQVVRVQHQAAVASICLHTYNNRREFKPPTTMPHAPFHPNTNHRHIYMPRRVEMVIGTIIPSTD